jgi:hypothetical protein
MLELRAAEKVIEPPVPGWERFFKIDWEAVEPRGRPVVRGYVLNDSPYTVTRMQLLLDALDGSGCVGLQPSVLRDPRATTGAPGTRRGVAD